MLKLNIKCYFVFRGNWTNGVYENYFCLPSMYYNFMPIEILEPKNNWSGDTRYVVSFLSKRTWCLPVELIETEFSLEAFIVSQLACPRKFRASPKEAQDSINAKVNTGGLYVPT